MEQQHLGSPTGGYVMSSRSALQPDLTYYSELQPPADTYGSQAGISDAGVEQYVEQTLTEVLQRAQSRAGSQGLPESMWQADARQQQQACLAEAQQPQGHRLGFARGPAKRGASRFSIGHPAATGPQALYAHNQQLMWEAANAGQRGSWQYDAATAGPQDGPSGGWQYDAATAAPQEGWQKQQGPQDSSPSVVGAQSIGSGSSPGMHASDVYRPWDPPQMRQQASPDQHSFTASTPGKGLVHMGSSDKLELIRAFGETSEGSPPLQASLGHPSPPTHIPPTSITKTDMARSQAQYFNPSFDT